MCGQLTSLVLLIWLLTLKPSSFYNIEKHVNRKLILVINHECCAHITDCGLIAYQRIQALFTCETQTYKLSFGIKSLLYKEEITPYKAMNPTSSYPM